MNKAQLQTEAFKHLVTRRNPVAYERDDGDVYITFDGYSAFSVPEKDVCIDTSKMRHMPSLKQLFMLGDGYTEAKLTKRCTMFDANGGILREYRAIDDASKSVCMGARKHDEAVLFRGTHGIHPGSAGCCQVCEPRNRQGGSHHSSGACM